MPITASAGSAAFAATRPDLDDLIKRRFFYRQAFEIYGGVAGFYTCAAPAAPPPRVALRWRAWLVMRGQALRRGRPGRLHSHARASRGA